MCSGRTESPGGATTCNLNLMWWQCSIRKTVGVCRNGGYLRSTIPADFRLSHSCPHKQVIGTRTREIYLGDPLRRFIVECHLAISSMHESKLALGLFGVQRCRYPGRNARNVPMPVTPQCHYYFEPIGRIYHTSLKRQSMYARVTTSGSPGCVVGTCGAPCMRKGEGC